MNQQFWVTFLNITHVEEIKPLQLYASITCTCIHLSVWIWLVFPNWPVYRVVKWMNKFHPQALCLSLHNIHCTSDNGFACWTSSYLSPTGYSLRTSAHASEMPNFCTTFPLLCPEIACSGPWGIRLTETTHHMPGTEEKQSNTWEIIEATLNLLWRTMCHLINIVSVDIYWQIIFKA